MLNISPKWAHPFSDNQYYSTFSDFLYEKLPNKQTIEPKNPEKGCVSFKYLLFSWFYYLSPMTFLNFSSGLYISY